MCWTKLGLNGLTEKSLIGSTITGEHMSEVDDNREHSVKLVLELVRVLLRDYPDLVAKVEKALL